MGLDISVEGIEFALDAAPEGGYVAMGHGAGGTIIIHDSGEDI